MARRDPISSSTGIYGPDSSGAPNYIAGAPWGICDRCAGKYRLYGAPDCLRTEWTGLKVCFTCWDPRPPEMTPPKVWPEGVGIPNAKPEPPNIFVDVPAPYPPPEVTYLLSPVTGDRLLSPVTGDLIIAAS